MARVLGWLIPMILLIIFVALIMRSRRRSTEKHKDLIREADKVLNDAEEKRKQVNEELKNESKENIRRRFFDAFRRKPGSGK